MNLAERQNQFVELFAGMPSWQERFQYLIDIGAQLPELPASRRTPAVRVFRCLSQTFFSPSVVDGVIRIEGWSNATIPSGLIALIREIFDGVPLSELRQDHIYFHTDSLLAANLTGQRREALADMLERVKRL